MVRGVVATAGLNLNDGGGSQHDLVRVALALGRAGGDRRAAVEIARGMGSSARVARLIETKAAVGGAVTTDADYSALNDSRIASTAFISSLRGASVFFTALENGQMIRVPFHSRIVSTTLNATSFVVSEGAATPASRLALDNLFLEPTRVAGLVVLSDALLRAAGPSGEEFLAREMRRATAVAVDTAFFDLVTDTSTPTEAASGGATASDCMQDLRSLFSAVGLTSESRPVFVTNAAGAQGLATMLSPSGGLVFPAATVAGGSLLGVPLMISDQVPAGELMLIDFSGVVGQADQIVVEVSNETSIEMANPTTSSSATATAAATVSLFQTNMVGILVKAVFGAVRVRDSAVAVLTGIGWSNQESI